MAKEHSVQKELAGLKRQATEINARIAKLEEVEAKRQQCQNDPIQEALCLLQSEYFPLDKLLQQDYPDLIHNRDFWWAFLETKDTMAPGQEVWRLLESEKPTSILEEQGPNGGTLLLRFLYLWPNCQMAVR